MQFDEIQVNTRQRRFQRGLAFQSETERFGAELQGLQSPGIRIGGFRQDLLADHPIH